MEVPSVENGSSRWFDPRLSLDCWKRSLSGRQYERCLAEQLQFWYEKLSPAEPALRHFKTLGYWAVIDCQAWGPPTLQFRIPSDVRTRLGRLALDLDFAVFGVGGRGRREG